MNVVKIGTRPIRRPAQPSQHISSQAGKIPFMSKLQSFLKTHDGKSLVAYLCLEYGLKSSLQIYGGGLGVLAGDTLKSAADLGLPIVGVGLLYREGNFVQKFDKHNWQIEEPAVWDPAKEGVEDLGITILIPMNGDKVAFKVWGYWVEGGKGGGVPLLLLDSAVEGNSGDYYNITRNLYAKEWLEIAQRAVLGIGGMMVLEGLGLD